MRDGLAAIRQRAQFGPFVVPGPDVQLRVETLATLLDDVERLLAIAEAAIPVAASALDDEAWVAQIMALQSALAALDQDTPQ